MNLKELYDSNRDIRESEIPEEWKDSFYKFMFGQTCLVYTDENGNVKEFIYYYHDFRRWYHLNQTQIERDLKINSITEVSPERPVVPISSLTPSEIFCPGAENISNFTNS